MSNFCFCFLLLHFCFSKSERRLWMWGTVDTLCTKKAKTNCKSIFLTDFRQSPSFPIMFVSVPRETECWQENSSFFSLSSVCFVLILPEIYFVIGKKITIFSLFVLTSGKNTINSTFQLLVSFEVFWRTNEIKSTSYHNSLFLLFCSSSLDTLHLCLALNFKLFHVFFNFSFVLC